MYVTCVALWFILIIQADTRKIPLMRKVRITKYLGNSGLFCLYNLKYTNVISTR